MYRPVGCVVQGWVAVVCVVQPQVFVVVAGVAQPYALVVAVGVAQPHVWAVATCTGAVSGTQLQPQCLRFGIGVTGQVVGCVVVGVVVPQVRTVRVVVTATRLRRRGRRFTKLSASSLITVSFTGA